MRTAQYNSQLCRQIVHCRTICQSECMPDGYVFKHKQVEASCYEDYRNMFLGSLMFLTLLQDSLNLLGISNLQTALHLSH